MAGILKYVISGLLLGSAAVSGSFLWPRFTDKPRPELLRRVYESVSASAYGESIASVLGVSYEAENTPVDLDHIAKQAAGQVVSKAGEYTSDIIFRETMKQLSGQIEKLTPQEKAELQNLVCSPGSAEATDSTGTDE